MAIAKFVLFMVFASLCIFFHVDAKGQVGDKIRLPGHQLGIEDALKKSDAIITAKVIDHGSPSLRAPGQVRYRGMHLENVKLLLGSGDFSTISMIVLDTPQTKAELDPVKGTDYIFFIKLMPQGQNPQAIKSLLFTPENANVVSDAIRRNDASQPRSNK